MIKNDLFLTVPVIILSDRQLSTTDRMLLSIIIALDNKDGCFANNKTLADMLNCSVSTISKSINHLIKLKYLVKNVENPKKGGRGYIRKVREDLKSHKRDKSDSETSLFKTEREVSLEPTLIYKAKKKVTDKHKKCNREENKLSLFNKCKIIYEKEYKIVWTKDELKALGTICNLINSESLKKLKMQVDDGLIESVFIAYFKIIIFNPPEFFRDRVPSTYIRYWNKVITDKKVIEKMKCNLRRLVPKEESFI